MKIAIITLALAAPGAAGAQQEWSLDRCVSYAIEHATEVGRERIEQKQALTEYRTSLLDFLPSVSAQVSGQYNWDETSIRRPTHITMLLHSTTAIR